MNRNVAPTVILATIASLAFGACGKRGSDKLPEGERPPGAPNLESRMLTIQISELQEHAESGLVTYAGKLFSGQAVELNPNGSRKREYHYYEGLKHGPIREFYENGGNKSDTMFVKGVAQGHGLEWDESQRNVTEVLFEHGEEVNRFPAKINMSPKQNEG